MARANALKKALKELVRGAMIKRLDDGRVAAWYRLGTSRQARDGEGLFQVEGLRPVELLLDEGVYSVESLIVCGEEVLKRQDAMRERVARVMQRMADAGMAIYDVSRDVFRRIANVNKIRGVMVIARQRKDSVQEVLDKTMPSRPLLLAAVGVSDPGNLGALARSGFAFGVGALFALDGTTDLYHPKFIRASAGHLPMMVGAGWETFRACCVEHGVLLVGLDPKHRDAIGLETFDAHRAKGLAVCVGSEGCGFSSQEAFDVRIRIPMRAGAESLNLGVAGSLVLWELMKKRQMGSW